MEVIKEDRILKFNPGTLQTVRKEYNLDHIERLNEALDILENWIKKQDHFVKKDYSRGYLERTLISTKGSVERAKLRLDKLCTFRTLMPNFFCNSDIKEQYECLATALVHGHLTRQTHDNFRVYVMKMISEDPINPANMLKYYKYIIAASEYVKKNDYSKGYVLIMDYTGINLVTLVTKVSPIDLHQTMMLLTEGYGMRIKGIHIITPSRMVDALITLLKQVLSAKVAERIHIHKTIDTVYKHVEKEILPQDYEAWFEVLSSTEYTKYLNEMNEACTNESCRQREKFHEQYLGIPGSFRSLSVD
ncbi:hypothetical protein K1T71_011322 [Dendrolimus kikuchii]|uniref:Uncharacterized protein n=1 Tax=Dendrolimus kikuchii TaxID=765133 RepID=A0ACC1CNI0_9NEOP|nr:hypothetical protein K1T71_011322 [Dendrolimus kikuchii]